MEMFPASRVHKFEHDVSYVGVSIKVRKIISKIEGFSSVVTVENYHVSTGNNGTISRQNIAF